MSNSCDDENALPGKPSSGGHGRVSPSLTRRRRFTALSLDVPQVGMGRGYIPISARATITGGRQTFGPLNTPPSSLNSPHATQPPVITPSASHARAHAPSNLQQPKNHNIVNRNSVYEENNRQGPILCPVTNQVSLKDANQQRRQVESESGFQTPSNSTGTFSNARRQNLLTQQTTRALNTPHNTQQTARPYTFIFKRNPATEPRQSTNQEDGENLGECAMDPQRTERNAGTRHQTPIENDSDGECPADDEHPVDDEHPADDERVKEYMVRLNHQRELLRTAEDVEGEGPTAAESLDTWAKRLPTAVVQPIRSRVYRPKTLAERQTIKMRSAQTKENAEALLAEVKAFHALRDKLVTELAEKFRKKEDYIRVLLCSSSTLKSTRKPNLKNAILHMKAKELNEGREEGNRLKLLEVQNMINIEEIMQELTADEKGELLQELEDHRKLKKKGARASNISAAQDMRFTIQRLSQEADNLASRTGAHVFLFTSRGDVQDSGVPGWMATANTDSFFTEVLKIDAWNLLRQFENWACSHGQAGKKADSWPGLRAQCSNFIIGGLKHITNMDNICMNYVNYDKSIVQKYRVKIVGWPENIKFTNPASLTSMDELRQLRQALRTHDCHWVKITEREVRLHMESLKEREAAGESVGRKRKQRSDKGKPRKRRAVRQPDDEDCADEEEDGSEVDDEDESTPVGRKRKQRIDRGKPRKKRRAVRQPDDEDCADKEEDGSEVDDEDESIPSVPSGPSRIQTRSKTGHRTSRARPIIASDEESLPSGSEFNDN